MSIVCKISVCYMRFAFMWRSVIARCVSSCLRWKSIAVGNLNLLYFILLHSFWIIDDPEKKITNFPEILHLPLQKINAFERIIFPYVRVRKWKFFIWRGFIQIFCMVYFVQTKIFFNFPSNSAYLFKTSPSFWL